MAMLTGQTGGCIGETSALALLAGGRYLLLRVSVITPRIPAAYLGTVALFCRCCSQRRAAASNGCSASSWRRP